MYLCHGMHVGVRRQLVGVGSLFTQSGFITRRSSGLVANGFPTEPSHWPNNFKAVENVTREMIIDDGCPMFWSGFTFKGKKMFSLV